MTYIVHKAIEADALSAKTKAKLNAAPQTWIISPKFDGCHAIFCFDNGGHIATFSRTGEPVYSMGHIARELAKVVPKQGRWAFCGEAWHPAQEFNVISGWFRKQNHSLPELFFAPFDLVSWNYNDDTFGTPPVHLHDGRSYAARLDQLHTLIAEPLSQIVKPDTYVNVATLDDVVAANVGHARFLKGLGVYDGCVIAAASGKYEVGSGKGGEFIKLKPLLSVSVVVNGYEPAYGEKTGKNTVALRFNLDGKTQRVSTGLTQAQVDDIVYNFKDNWRGACIEVEAMGKTVNGFLREPRFKGIRTDA